MRNWSKQDELILRSNHTKTNLELSKLTGKSQRTISYYRSAYNLPCCMDDGRRRKNKERENLSEFELGWCLGMFSTDGWVQKSGKKIRVGLSLSLDDRDTVEKFFHTIVENFDSESLQIKLDNTNTYSKKGKVSYVATLPKFTSEIYKYINFTRKTYDMCLTPEFLNTSQDFKNGFLRGVIDGDGYVRSGGNEISIVSASQKFITDLQKIFGGVVRKRKHGDYWNLHFRKNEIKLLISKGLLSNTGLPMARKTKRLEGCVA